MYSDADLEAAVSAGTLSQEAADALRNHVSAQRPTPAADEENFRLITSFNDIFVTLAGILVLVSAAWIGAQLFPVMGAAALAAVAWGLAEFFTLKRRMALPSIVFFIAFVFGVYGVGMALFSPIGSAMGIGVGPFANQSGIVGSAVSSAMVVGACWVHWLRFRVPITIAWGTVAIVMFIFSLIAPMLGAEETPQLVLWLLLLCGLGVFAFAMWWDMQDTLRTKRDSDVAFWLHLFASPMIVHPIFLLMGWNIVGNGTSTPGAGLAVVAILLYCAFAVVALIVDRRAFLVSAMIYVLAAIVYLFSSSGVDSSFFPVAALIIGSGLLMMSAFWQKLRAVLLRFLPDHIRGRLPATNRV
jgi:hypothetical protein